MPSSLNVLPILYCSRLEKGPYARAKSRPCFHQGLFHKYSIVLDWRRSFQCRVNRGAPLRADGPTISWAVKFQQALECEGLEEKQSPDPQGRSPNEREWPEHAIVTDHSTNRISYKSREDLAMPGRRPMSQLGLKARAFFIWI